MLYFESVLMSNGRFVCGAVSSTRTMACLHLSIEQCTQHIKTTDDQLSAIVRLCSRAPLGDVSTARELMCAGELRILPYLGSSRPHHTPIPATEPALPFPLHAPSEYTTSQPDSSWIFSVLSAAHFEFEPFALFSTFETGPTD